MQCDYFDAGECRSCTWMGQPYPDQVAAKDTAARQALRAIADDAWHEPFTGPETGFRNKAKLIVGGRRGDVTLGILDDEGGGVDLRNCGICEPPLAQAVASLAEAINAIGLTPYDVPAKQGELKNVQLTYAPSGALMARFVLRSPGQLGRLTRHLPDLHDAMPGLRVASANIHPEHKATLAGDDEHPLTEERTLAMAAGDVTLHLAPDAFFQTNTAVASGLYRQARDWAAATGAGTVWDLYGGVGGFALHAALALPDAHVTGVEVSPGAAPAARHSAEELHVNAEFITGDATRWASQRHTPADLVIVNPPRRGIGPDLATWLDTAGPAHVLYSSCNPTTLAADLDRMPSYTATAARMFDMFPHTRHAEVLVALQRG